MNTDIAYSIIVQARDKLVSEGYMFPKIEMENVHFDENSEIPYYAVDLNINEEKLFSQSFIRLEQIIFDIMGMEWKPMEKGFWVHFDDNFSKEEPKEWREERIRNRMAKNWSGTIPLPQLSQKPKEDEYETWTEVSTEATEVPEVSEKPAKVEEPISNDDELPTLLPDTYGDMEKYDKM